MCFYRTLDKKGYKVYNLETHTVIISKDVVFQKKSIPYNYSIDKDNKMSKQTFLPAVDNTYPL